MGTITQQQTLLFCTVLLNTTDMMHEVLFCVKIASDWCWIRSLLALAALTAPEQVPHNADSMRLCQLPTNSQLLNCLLPEQLCRDEHVC